MFLFQEIDEIEDLHVNQVGVGDDNQTFLVADYLSLMSDRGQYRVEANLLICKESIVDCVEEAIDDCQILIKYFDLVSDVNPSWRSDSDLLCLHEFHFTLSSYFVFVSISRSNV